MLIETAIEIRDLRPGDWPEVAKIFAEGIEGGNATFETDVPTWDAWDAAHLPEHRFAATEDSRVVGWAALAPVSRRACYRGVVEESVYVATRRHGRGIGRALLERVIASAEAAGIWTIEAGVTTFPQRFDILRLSSPRMIP